MADIPTLEELTRKLGEMAQRQQQFQQEITELQRAIYDLKRKELAESKPAIAEEKIQVKQVKVESEPVIVRQEGVIEPPKVQPPAPPPVKVKKVKTPIEEFIGTNLLNKIGIAVLVVGIGIGAEYAIDHDLISPLTRIILGYLSGIILIGVAIRLKPNYQNFSAVLLSGGMAVLYFITFAAYDLYSLIPQTLAFVLMVLFTAFTVFASLQYNLRVIAIIGLVGAYAVPFLLSDGSGRVVILFSYMTIINIGVLVLAFKKDWKQLYYLAFGLTWLIFAAWYLDAYEVTTHLWTVLIFSSVFFVTFYTTLLAYKLILHERLARWDVVLLLLNSFIYFGIGYDAIEAHQDGDTFLGLFTLFNAVLHFLACYVIFSRKEQSKDVFYFVAGLVLVFLTLAVPVQLEGNWVTIIWAGEAALLFWIGRSKGFPVYEKLSYPLILLAFGSLVQDWDNFYGHYTKGVVETFVTPFFNIQLLVSLMVCIALGAIIKISLDRKDASPLKPGSAIDNLFMAVVPALLLIALYTTFFLEVESYWKQRLVDSELTVQEGTESTFHMDYDLMQFKNLWILNYSAVFTFVVALVNFRWIKNKVLGYVVFGFGSLVLFSFVTTGMVNITALRYSYLNPTDAQYYFRGTGHILIRYISIVLIAPLLWVNYALSRGEHFNDVARKAERIFFHFVILALLGSELVGGLALAGIDNSEKLALSILWGGYALGLIVYGLMKDLKYIRVTGITLFLITLIKLFFYDMADMGTISKTMVMIVLGVLLLIASFLYNKFKKPAHAQS